MITTNEGVKRVVVADDERAARWSVGNFFRSLNYDVLEAENGREALALARSYQPDAVITDLRMPVMDGLDLIQALRKDPRTCFIYIIVYSVILRENNNHLEAVLRGANIALDRLAFVEAETPLQILQSYVEQWPNILRQQLYTGGPNRRFQLDRFNQVAVVNGERRTDIADYPLELFKILVKNPGRVWNYGELTAALYSEEIFIGRPRNDDRLMRVIRRLREKIEARPSQPIYFITHPGGRYELVNPEIPA